MCVQYEEDNKDKEAFEKHIKLKDMPRRQKGLDKERYAEDKSTVVSTEDLESVLLAPALKASALYYRAKLPCHNYTIYDLHSHDAKCYFQHEGEEGLDADTFDLKYDFFKTYTDLTYYSTIRPGNKVGDQVVTDIRQLRYKDGSLEYKLDYSETYFLPLPPKCTEDAGSVRRKYAETLKIKKSKYDDLQALKAVLPQDCRAFYDGLTYTKDSTYRRVIRVHCFMEPDLI